MGCDDGLASSHITGMTSSVNACNSYRRERQAPDRQRASRYHIPLRIGGREWFVGEPRGHRFVEPKVIPPFARDIIAEP